MCEPLRITGTYVARVVHGDRLALARVVDAIARSEDLHLDLAALPSETVEKRGQ
jgi:hypothetical protein